MGGGDGISPIPSRRASAAVIGYGIWSWEMHLDRRLHAPALNDRSHLTLMSLGPGAWPLLGFPDWTNPGRAADCLSYCLWIVVRKCDLICKPKKFVVVGALQSQS